MHLSILIFIELFFILLLGLIVYVCKKQKNFYLSYNFNLLILKTTRPFLPPFFRLIAPARWAKQRITKSPNLRFSDKANY